jgi:hypothetical protein
VTIPRDYAAMLRIVPDRPGFLKNGSGFESLV